MRVQSYIYKKLNLCFYQVWVSNKAAWLLKHDCCEKWKSAGCLDAMTMVNYLHFKLTLQIYLYIIFDKENINNHFWDSCSDGLSNRLCEWNTRSELWLNVLNIYIYWFPDKLLLFVSFEAIIIKTLIFHDADMRYVLWYTFSPLCSSDPRSVR